MCDDPKPAQPGMLTAALTDEEKLIERVRHLGTWIGDEAWRDANGDHWRARDALYKAAAHLTTQAEEIARLTAELGEVTEERDKAQALVEHVRESLRDQALARHDPQMPLLAPDMLERLENESEAAYALSEDQADRVYAHALSLLHAWQTQARAQAAEAKLAALTVGGEERTYSQAEVDSILKAAFPLQTPAERKTFLDTPTPDLVALKEAVARLSEIGTHLAQGESYTILPGSAFASDLCLALPALRNALRGGHD